jgi:hypothetical protein
MCVGQTDLDGLGIVRASLKLCCPDWAGYKIFRGKGRWWIMGLTYDSGDVIPPRWCNVRVYIPCLHSQQPQHLVQFKPTYSCIHACAIFHFPSLGIELLDQMHVSLFISNRDVYLKNIIHIWYQIGTYVSVVWPAETNRSASIFGRNTDLLHRHIPTYLGIKQTDNLILPLDAKNLCRGGSGLIIAGLSQAWASYFGLGLFAGMKNLLNKSGSSRAQDLLSK